MTFEITITDRFSASHQLWLYDGSRESIHGHNWTVMVTVGASELDRIGVVMDFHVLERKLRKLINPFHNHHINDVEPFTELNPSAENIAAYLARSLKLPPRVRLLSVEVWETPENRARVKLETDADR